MVRNAPLTRSIYSFTLLFVSFPSFILDRWCNAINTFERVSSSRMGESDLEGFRLMGIADMGHNYISINGYNFGVS